MFERFSDRARRVISLAPAEARTLNHNYIGTEHLLLGLIHEGEGVAAKTLESLGISLETVRTRVEEIIGPGQQVPTGHIPFNPYAKRVLELAHREALQLGHSWIGTEHLLLGLIREGEGVACQILTTLGASLTRVRQQVIQLLSSRYSLSRLADEGAQTDDAWIPDDSELAAIRDEMASARAVPYQSSPTARQVMVMLNEVKKILADHDVTDPPEELVGVLVEWKLGIS